MKCVTKQIALLLIVLTPTTRLFAQHRNSECDYKIEKVGAGQYKIQVDSFDSLNYRGETCFMSWMNTAKGKPDGELLFYDEKGRKRRSAMYEGGIRVGTHREWYETGEIRSTTNWETDMYFNSIDYYKSGKIRSTAVNGNRDNAVYTSYFENGQIKSINDNSAKIDKTYYPNGQIKTDMSNTEKTYTEWYSNGQIRRTGPLDQENLYTKIGKWSYYDSTGKLVRELFYSKDSAVWYDREKGYRSEKKYD